MRRVTILSILGLILICAVGVTFAREGELAGGPPENTTVERTDPESDLPEATTPAEASPVGQGRSEKTTEDRDPRNDNGDEESRGPETAASAEDDAREEVADDGGRKGRGGEGREKVTVCHKGKKTLTVGAPAEEAHARHGDTLGACKGGP